jgi:hypothetical protein
VNTNTVYEYIPPTYPELATPLIETEVEKYENLGTHRPCRPLVFRKEKKNSTSTLKSNEIYLASF